MSFGYLLIVAEDPAVDYLKMAYALALSIKTTQKPGYDKVALVLDDKKKLDRFTSPWIFDEIIEWSEETFWNGRSYMYELTPWENTVCLDVDMLFFRDYSHWIEYFVDNSELYVANKSFTYRGEIVESDEYRKTFTANSLPNLYSFFTFFKSDRENVQEFFELAKTILKNPKEFSNLYLTKHKPLVIGTDEAFALSAKILGISDELAYPLLFPKVVHMKPLVQNFPWPANNWSDHLGFYFTEDCQLKIGNYQQDNIVHYVEKNKITDEIINLLEEKAWKL
jgi:hypothetical protein